MSLTGKGGPDVPSGDHYAMTTRRKVFEMWHRSMGWSTLVLAVAASDDDDDGCIASQSQLSLRCEIFYL